MSARARAASGARSRTRRARRATRSSSARARSFGADVVALGHTRDDQAETFLLRLLRGAGPRGLASMHPRRGAIIRPLLDCRRASCARTSTRAASPFVDDESNADVGIPRNRVRAELLPLLEQRFNPSIVDVLADEAELARDEWRLDGRRGATSSWPPCVRTGRRHVGALDAAALPAAPLALAPLGRLAGDDGGRRAAGRSRSRTSRRRSSWLRDGGPARSTRRDSAWNASAPTSS